jgi:hypothetical protein
METEWIFVSSTFKDLKQHRKAVFKTVQKTGSMPDAMEFFPSLPGYTKDECLSRVERSVLFIGIYAHRYGWIPKGDSLSMTEQEYDHAQRMKIPCLCYILDRRHYWAPWRIEKGKIKEIEALKKRVKKRPITPFTTPEDLARKVAEGIANWYKKQYRLSEDQRRSVEQENARYKIEIGSLSKATDDEAKIYIEKNERARGFLEAKNPDKALEVLVESGDEDGYE